MIKVIALITAALPGFAAAQEANTCMFADEMDAALIDWHGETVVAETPDGTAALWQNGTSGTWTIVQYHKTGKACVLSSGVDLPFDAVATEQLVHMVR